MTVDKMNVKVRPFYPAHIQKKVAAAIDRRFSNHADLCRLTRLRVQPADCVAEFDMLVHLLQDTPTILQVVCHGTPSGACILETPDHEPKLSLSVNFETALKQASAQLQQRCAAPRCGYRSDRQRR